jgi:hypothetical protein
MVMVHCAQKHVLKKYFVKAKVVDSTTTLEKKNL